MSKSDPRVTDYGLSEGGAYKLRSQWTDSAFERKTIVHYIAEPVEMLPHSTDNRERWPYLVSILSLENLLLMVAVVEGKEQQKTPWEWNDLFEHLGIQLS